MQIQPTKEIISLIARPYCNTFNMNVLYNKNLLEQDKFIYLKNKLDDWNAEYEQQGFDSKGHLERYSLLKQLHMILSECVLTKLRSLQNEQLNQAFKWYQEKFKKYDKKDLTTDDLKQKFSFQNDYQIGFSESKYHQPVIKEKKDIVQYVNDYSDYKEGLRYHHNDLDMPENRLGDFGRKNIQNYHHDEIKYKSTTKLDSNFNTTQSFYKDDQKFNMSSTLNLGRIQDISNQKDNGPELRLNRTWHKNRNKDYQEKLLDEEFVSFMNQWSKQKSRTQSESSRRIEMIKYGSQMPKREFKRKDFQTPEDDDDLDFNTTKVSFNHQSLQTFHHNINQRTLQRTSQYNKFNPQLQNATYTDFKQAKKIQQIDDIEKLMSVISLNKTKLMTNKIIQSKTDLNEEDRPEFRTSLSVFGNSQNNFNQRPFSRLMSSVQDNDFTSMQFRENNNVKHSLAKYQIPINAKVIANALLRSEHYSNQNALPKQGSRLIFCPIENGGKKGKKGKGKKKK